MTRCVACLQGFAWECENDPPCTNSVADNNEREPNSSTPPNETNQATVSESFDFLDEVGETSGRQVNTHNDGNLKDQQSTGRKRAAVMYPLSDAACEWKMRKNCGGGPKPIVGCVNGRQQARHHGPDKNTLNNDPGNVHRICHVCHNRWHTENDDIYVWGIIQANHNPIDATMPEMAANEMYWAGRSTVKATD